MATVDVGSVWNLQDCLRSSVPIKCMPQSFYPDDQRLGQFRDLPIISLWGNMKTFPVSHKPIEAIQFFQDHPSNLCRAGCSWRSGSRGYYPRLNEVKIRFSPKVATGWSRRANGAKRPGSLSRFGGCAYDLLGSWYNLDLWPDLRSSKSSLMWSTST